ncbi:MAG: polyphosphate polymerase domain-containing protein [Alphaproteobacteria bacterium]|nr:polyphosphate polymerase domain-containing protein [Alphaproteobacteria bacterium]
MSRESQWASDPTMSQKLGLSTCDEFGEDDQLGSAACLTSDPGIDRRTSLSPPEIIASLRKFSAISLEDTNKFASMLKRIDNKYVVDRQQLLSVLDVLRDGFRILRIDERGIFSYESCYFDDNYQCFSEHRQGRRQRFKVRTRRYVESGLAFFEVKLKGKRGQTEKSRAACDHYDSFVVNDREQQMLRELYEKNYGKAFHYRMVPALHVSYRRFTLVSASGRERITVDLNLGFETPSGKHARIGDDFIIIETKTADGRGKSDRALKQKHIRTADGCSKYCIGMALTGEVQRYNKFRAIVRKARSRMPTSGERCLQRDPVRDPSLMLDRIARC